MADESLNDGIDFKCGFGVWPFRKNLNITPAGFQYCGELFPLGTITRLRWGVECKRGILFHKDIYIASFGTDTREVVIKTRLRDFYEQLTKQFWRAAGQRLLAAMLLGLRGGRAYRFGDLSVTDDGVSVIRSGLSKTAPPEFYAWEKIKWRVENGCLVFTSADESLEHIASVSFLRVDNAHILSVALALFEKHQQKLRLSAVAE